jgi:hypothetical protein
MSTPSIIVGRGNWGVKPGNLLGYSLVDSLYLPREFTCSRADNTATRINRNGNIEGVNANVPRIDYFGGQASLLVEPSGINSIRNNSMVGAVAGSLPGSPGTLPMNWAESLNGLVRQSVALGTENGVSYIDIRYSGTATGGSCAVLFETATQIVASTGQTWSNSVYLKIIAQPNPPIAYRLGMWEYNTSGTVFGGSFATAVVPTTTSLQRFTQTRALTGATTDRVRPLFDVSMTSGQTYDFTIRIGYPQMEQSSVATSVIPTTTGSVTRNADVISLTNVAGLIGQTAGTIYCEFAYFGQPVIRSGPIYLRQAGTTGISINFAPSDFPAGISFISRNSVGSDALIIVPGALQIGTYYKIAVGYDAGGTAAGGSQANGVVAYVNGVQTAIGTFRVPDAAGLTEFRMYGANAGTDAEAFNGRIRAAEIYPTRLPNVAQPGVLSLQSLTTI